MSLDGLTRALYHSDTAAVRLGRMTPLGFAGGLLDLIGGGGPIVTSTLLGQGATPLRDWVGQSCQALRHRDDFGNVSAHHWVDAVADHCDLVAGGGLARPRLGGLLDVKIGPGSVRNRIRLTVDRDRATGGDRIPLGLRGWSAAVFAGAPSGRHPVPAALMDVNVRGRRSQ